MAYTASFIAPHKSLARAAVVKLSALSASLESAVSQAVDRSARLDVVSRLEALSDTELAARGLTRDTIVAHVFRDRFCY